MKKFIGLCFSLLLATLIFLVLIAFLVDGYDDPFYLRFTSPKQSSLILGSSRSAQGIRPDVLNTILNRDDIYNYSFTNFHSPFGKVYLESIKNKLDQNSVNSIFIISVSPYSICNKEGLDLNNYQLREEKSILNDTPVNKHPNFNYLFRHYDRPFYNIFLKNEKMHLKKDGWLEITIPMDSNSVKNRTEKKIASKAEDIQKWKFSSYRLDFLSKTINYLKKYGNVFLVRIPIVEDMLKIEDIIMEDFENRMNELSVINEIDYISFARNYKDYNYTDGNHLDKTSAYVFSKQIAKWIKSKIDKN